MQETPLNILVSAYACGPKWGSEIGMGWNWVTSLANHCRLTVITESGFKDDIEESLLKLSLRHIPEFHFIDIGETGRKLFWKQGSFSFYRYYRKWQALAYLAALDILKTKDFDLVHQLNMIGYREPGFLWKIKTKPFIWGPVGGFTLMPLRFLPAIGVRSALFFVVKNLINVAQMHSLSRVKKAFSRSDVVLAATNEAQFSIKKNYNINAFVLNETGARNGNSDLLIKRNNVVPVIIWCGLITGRKALPLALKTINKLDKTKDFQFHIFGDGPDRVFCERLAKKLGIESKCFWHGQVENAKVILKMRGADLLFFTSLVEGTPHVVLEALANGCPVICHDTCGQGSVVNEKCGIKIPVISPDKSVTLFAQSINELFANHEKITSLSLGAKKRAEELSWDNKVTEMLNFYNLAIRKHIEKNK